MQKQSKSTQNLSYRDAGVDIDAGNRLVEQIKSDIKRTHRPEVISHLGGFGGLFELPIKDFKHPVLVSGTDGVGTKLKLAITLQQHSTIGIDLVAMCVNDILVCGAEPLFFLDYYATGKLDVDIAKSVISGIARGCEISGAALIGGETAEMPGIYQEKDYDLAGFAVGIIERENIIDGSKINPGDTLIGLASSGPHSNGYSLIRKIIDDSNTSLDIPCGSNTLAEALLAPTRIYVRSILKLLKEFEIHAIAHITGGGFIENLPRVMPNNTCAIIDKSNWSTPEVFSWLQNKGKITDHEMHKTFNCGIGLILCVNSKDAELIIDFLQDLNEQASIIGSITSSEKQQPDVKII